MLSDQNSSISAYIDSPCPDRRLADEETYPEELAQRWVFERVLSLGWTPEKFGDFDKHRFTSDSGEHKAERFGKKYQWIALRELVARIADNFHAMNLTYEEPWEFPDPGHRPDAATPASHAQ